MADVIHRRNDCRGCGSRDLELVFSLKPSPIGDAYVTPERADVPQPSYPINLHMCQKCGLAQILDVIDPETLNGEYIDIDASSLSLVQHFGEYASKVMSKSNIPKGSLVVNICSNDGIRGGLRCGNDSTLLRCFQEWGMRVLGVEPAARIAVQTSSDGIKSIDKFFTTELATKIVADHGHANLITANNVLANIDDLTSWINAVDELLAGDGVFVFESCYLADLVQNMVFDFIYHEHLSTFSVKPIQALFERVGLELVAVDRIPTKGGSLRYFIQRPGGPVAKDGSVTKLRALEDHMGLYRKETFSAFADKVDGLRMETQKFLSQAKSKGKSVAGFGASITGTTLIYHFEIGRYLDYLVDDNIAKQGRLSPGLHLPVLPPSTLCERKPDYVVVLAWRFAETFISKHQAYLESGGSFVIPVPQFRIVSKLV